MQASVGGRALAANSQCATGPSVNRVASVAQIRQLCHLGLGAQVVVPALLKAIRQLIPSESAGFFWVDEHGDMVDLYAERMLSPTQMRVYFERHYDSADHRFRDRFVGRARAGEVVASMSTDGELQQSSYYREILQPLDVHHVLYGIIRNKGSAIGQLSLYRSKRARPFGATDKAALESVVRYVAQGLAHSTEHARSNDGDSYRESEFEALAICDGKGAIRQASQKAFGLLARATGKPINRNTMSGELERAITELLARPARLVAIADKDPIAERPVLYVNNRWGRFRLRAYSLDSTDGLQEVIGVVIQQQVHFLVRFSEAMGNLRLSAQQKEAALLIARGCTNAEMATAMGVSVNTASYHVKQLFQKLDAHDRESAIARIEAARSQTATV